MICRSVSARIHVGNRKPYPHPSPPLHRDAVNFVKFVFTKMPKTQRFHSSPRDFSQNKTISLFYLFVYSWSEVWFWVFVCLFVCLIFVFPSPNGHTLGTRSSCTNDTRIATLPVSPACYCTHSYQTKEHIAQNCPCL